MHSKVGDAVEVSNNIVHDNTSANLKVVKICHITILTISQCVDLFTFSYMRFDNTNLLRNMAETTQQRPCETKHVRCVCFAVMDKKQHVRFLQVG